MSPTPGAQRIDATVRGRVQGVGFRWYVERKSISLGLTGWAANEDDGSVRVVAEGDSSALDALERELRRGPPAATVESVDVVRTVATGKFSRFGIRSRAHPGD